MTVTETVGAGFLAAYAFGVSSGTSSINWFGDNQNIANFLIPGFGTFLGNQLHGILIQCGGTGSTQFVIDVTGTRKWLT